MLKDEAVLGNVDLCQQILRGKYQYQVIQDSLDMFRGCVLFLVPFLGSSFSPESCSSFILYLMTSAFLFFFYFFFPYHFFLPSV